MSSAPVKSFAYDATELRYYIDPLDFLVDQILDYYFPACHFHQTAEDSLLLCYAPTIAAAVEYLALMQDSVQHGGCHDCIDYLTGVMVAIPEKKLSSGVGFRAKTK